MKKIILSFFILCIVAVGSISAQYIGSPGWMLDQMQKAEQAMKRQLNECYYFKTSNNVTFKFHVGLKMLSYNDASHGVFITFYQDGRISSGELSYHSTIGRFRLCRLNDGRFVINGPHTNGDVYVSSCTEAQYQAAIKACTYTDSRFSEDMYSIYLTEINSVNSSSYSSGDGNYSSSSSSYGQSGGYVKTVTALKLTINSESQVTNTSYESLDIYKGSDGSDKVKVGSNAPCSFHNNTQSTYLGTNVSGYRYWTMTVGSYGFSYYYYFNL